MREVSRIASVALAVLLGAVSSCSHDNAGEDAGGASGPPPSGADAEAGSSSSGSASSSGDGGKSSSSASSASGSGKDGGAGASSSSGAGSGSGSSGGSSSSGGMSSSSGSGSGSSSGAGSSSGSSGGTSGVSGLPTPPGAANVAEPSGTAGNLTVLPWAAFKAAVSWTFDDSQPSQIAHYAELEAVGVPMTFYISSGNSAEAGYDPTWTQAVKDGHEIGNHTVHHCQANLTGCSFGTPLVSLAVELDQCTAYIPPHTGQSDVWTGASPFGDTGYDTSAETRFFIYRGVGGGTIGPNDATDAFNLPIHLAAAAETAASFNTETDAAESAGRWLIFLIHTILPTTANWYNPVNVTDVTGGMSHGQSLGDVWMDTVASVGAYWRGQKLLSSAVPTTSGGVTTWSWTLPAHFPPGKYLRVTVGGGTLKQGTQTLTWNAHGYYEVALDAGSLTLSP